MRTGSDNVLADVSSARRTANRYQSLDGVNASRKAFVKPASFGKTFSANPKHYSANPKDQMKAIDHLEIQDRMDAIRYLEVSTPKL